MQAAQAVPVQYDENAHWIALGLVNRAAFFDCPMTCLGVEGCVAM